MTFLDHLNSPKFDFTQNQSGGKILKFQQSQALTSHFESFWSIVPIVIFFSGIPPAERLRQQDSYAERMATGEKALVLKQTMTVSKIFTFYVKITLINCTLNCSQNS